MQSQQQMRTNTLPKLNKNILTMPKWVNEAQDRIGPKPPAPPPSLGNSSAVAKPPALPPKATNQVEPDYEVIEFSGLQYSNEPMLKNGSGLRPKTPDAKPKCTLCGSNNPWVTCDECAKQIFCASCDDMFHKHPKRKNHMRKAIEQNLPPIPPKIAPGQPGPTPPIAPPRRSKRGFPTPLLQRKNQVVSNSSAIPPPSPTPSMKSSTWHDRVDTLKRGMSFSNRPLPDTPKTPTPSEEMSSRSTTPKSVFDTIQRPPSVTLEKIKSKASATLDRMAILQQRYRQQKEEQERNRSNSVADQRQPQQQQFTASRSGSLGTRNMSSSVFNLNQAQHKPLESQNNWMNSHIQQAQSMAHLNCVNCTQPTRAWPPSPHVNQQRPINHTGDCNNQFCSSQQLNRSNLSLNMPAMYMMPQHHPGGMYPPPVFMNQRVVNPNMYPYPYPGMPVMNTGVIAMPPTARSRANSRANSRLPSPTLSRKSLTLRKKYSGYTETDPTDDEDSDQDDRRSLISNRSGMAGNARPRQRCLSSVSQGCLDDDSESTNPRNLRSKIRDQRRGSTAKSVQSDWTPERHNTSTNNVQQNVLKPSKIYSDLDSESSGTRALVQAKIQQKLEEGPMQKLGDTAPNKKSTESQIGKAKNKNQEELRDSDKLKENVLQENHSDGDDQNGSEEEEEEEVQHHAENKQENVVTGNIIKSDEEDGSPPLGPPPSTPDHEWECEFCTFVNEPKIKICSICCKTPSKPPTAPKKTLAEVPVKPTLIPKATTPSSVASASKTIAVKSAEPKGMTNGVATSKQSQSEDDSEAATSKKKVQENVKNSVDSVADIWAALDENIQATAGEVLRNAKSKNSQKVSTGCGPSPPREMSANTESKLRVSKEIGTSPPPQNISTQTYDTFPLLKIESKDQAKMPVENNSETQTENEESRNFKPQNVTKLNTTGTRSPASPDSNLAFYNDSSVLRNERDRYRSSNDLHHSEPSPVDFSPLPPLSGLGRRQSSIAELLGLQRAQSQMHPQYTLQNFTGEQSYFEYRPARDPETELYLLIKEAELYKFSSEELHVALKHCGSDMHPVQWLRENWPKLIQTVQSLATKYGQERAENTIGTISQSEAREALCINFGNIWQAVSECIEQRQRKYREISNKGNFSREDIVTALTAHHGNVEAALTDLSKTQLKPFLMRIWGSPGGIENESGTNLLQSPPTSSEMDVNSIKSDIHEFLNANALECAQNPILADPFTKDYSFQTHTSPNDHQYRLTDNLYNYSHDSKENTVSPFQLEESPPSNKNMLKDLETLIGNMEQIQAKQNEEVLRNIEGMLTNYITKKDLGQMDFGEERILMKSPINAPRTKHSEQSEAIGKPLDVKNFVWQHIQEIVPDLVQQVEKELMERDEREEEEQSSISNLQVHEIDTKQNDEMIKETLVKPEIKYSIIKEEVPPGFLYAAEIANFRLEFDRARDLVETDNFDAFSFEEAPRKFVKMFLAQAIDINTNQLLQPEIVHETIAVDRTQSNGHTANNVLLSTLETFQDWNTEIVDEASNHHSQSSSELKESQFQQGPIKSENQALLTERGINKQEVRADHNQSVLRSWEHTEAVNIRTKEHSSNENVEQTNQSPISNSIEANLIEEFEKTVASMGSSDAQSKDIVLIEDNVIDFEKVETNQKKQVNIVSSGDDKIQPESTKETPSTIKATGAKRKSTDKKSQLPRQKKKETTSLPNELNLNKLKIDSINTEISTIETNEIATEGRSKPSEAISSQTANLQSESNSEEIVQLTHAHSPINTEVPSMSGLKKEGTSSEDVNILPDQLKEIIPIAESLVNDETTSFKTSESVALANQSPVRSTDEAAESNAIKTKTLKSVKSSKIPVRKNTSISSNQSQRTTALEKSRINLDENPNNSNDLNVKGVIMSVDHIKSEQKMLPEEKATNDEYKVPPETNRNTLNDIMNFAQNQGIETVEDQNITNGKLNANDNNLHSNDVFQDVVEHSSDDEEKKIDSNDAKVTISNQGNVYEESSEDELFSLHSNNTAADEETPSKAENNVPGHNQQESDRNNEDNDAESISLTTKQNNNTTIKEFVPSSDPSKQNLSELVMDTKRLIKQMKDEINMVELESSEDESIDDYSDDYEDDDVETDDWDDEEEEEESDFNEEEEDEYLEENGNEADVHVDDVDEDYTETRYEYGEDEEARAVTLTTDEENVNKPNSEVSKYSTNKSLADDNSIPTDSEVENIELDHQEQPNVLEELNLNKSAAVTATELSNTQSLSFRASSSITNTPSPSASASSEIESSININVPFIAEATELMEVETGTQNEKGVKSQTYQNQPLRESQKINSLSNQSVEKSHANTTSTEHKNSSSIQNPMEGSNNTNTYSNETVELHSQRPIALSDENELENSRQEASNATARNTVSNDQPNVSTIMKYVASNLPEGDESGVSLYLKSEGAGFERHSSTEQSLSENDINTNAVIQQKTYTESANTSKIPKPKEIKKSNLKSRVPLRSKSFSGPPKPIGISSVKAIQQEFLNKHTQLTTTIAQLNPPPTVFRKKSITETISKLTKPFDSLDGPSTSAAAANIFKVRTQPRIPKKKYHETCFSDDDYETSSSEAEPEPIIARQRKQSVPVFRTYPSIHEPEVMNPEILARNLIEEQLVDNFAEAQIAAALINLKFQKDVSVWAAKECSDLDQAIGLLQKECELCMGIFAMNQMVSMLKCTHKCCKECAKTYFTVQITDRSINDCNCPFCKTPELHGHNQHEDENLEYFSNLDIFLKSILEPEVHELFQRKLRDRTLLQDPNFKWCVQCSSGFFARPKQKRLICPDCGSVTCSQCRKIWEKQHEGISCEKYLEWKEANDPEIQAQGVQRHLAQHGIDCPKCKFRYSLARGGCMHFTCTQCKFEFCYGCAKPFMMGAKCNVSPYCAKLGLHAHHPRNCLFYLRDKLPLQLQFLLKENRVTFDVDPVISQDEIASNTPGRCPVQLQKETPNGLVDVVCNGEVSERNAGLCRTHYVEYLSAKVAKARIDPLPIFDLTDCVQELRRRGIPLPERGPWDTDEIYKGMCSEIIKQKIPLETD